MPKPEVWFAIPSASPEKCRKVLPVWRQMGYKTAILQNFEKGDIPADIVVWRDSYPGWPSSVNILSKEIVPASCPIIVTGGDDMLPDPNHSAEQLAEQFLERFPDTFGVMQPHGDEFLAAKRYAGSPFLGRAWCQTMYGGRGPMYPGYHHNYADNELFWLSKGMGVLWDRPDLTHFHDHFTRDGRPQPVYWNSVRQRDLPDCLLYYARVHERFPGHEPMHTPGTPRSERFGDVPVDTAEMLVLADHRLLRTAIDNPYAHALHRGLKNCADAGLDPVAIYGFGFHTQVGAAALAEPPVRIDCIIDDNTANHGRRPWSIPVVSLAEAAKRNIKAVVLSANSVEDRLYANCAPLIAKGIHVERLYTAPAPTASTPARTRSMSRAAIAS